VLNIKLFFISEILIQRVRKLQPEEIARKIQQYDQELCTQVFLSELKPVLPSPEQVLSLSHMISLLCSSPVSKVGKLNIYRNSDPEELAGLHPSDRLMVKLIQIDRLGPRIEGMLYKSAFDETWSLLDDVRHCQAYLDFSLYWF
jgi:cytokinesis protein